MLRIELKEHQSSEPVKLTIEDVNYLISSHQAHISLIPQKDGRYVIKTGSYVGYIVLINIIISIAPKVQNENLIFMLSYMFNINFEKDISVGDDSHNPVIDIIAIIFINKVKELIRKGMFRGYLKKEEKIPGMKGKLPMSKNLFYIDKLHCVYDELSYSVYENLIIKATIKLLLYMEVSGIVKNESRKLLMLLGEIKDVELDERIFSRVNYSKLNLHYVPLIKYCYMIYRSLNIKNSHGNVQFLSFIIDMNVVFEEFIRKYLQKALPGNDIRKRSIMDWATGDRREIIPVIEPDIVIKNKLVIDVKYYRDILTDRGKLKNANLYQIITYMSSMRLSGLLIYPLNEVVVKESFYLKDMQRFSIYTLSLTGDFNEFMDELHCMTDFIRELFSDKDLNLSVDSPLGLVAES